MTETQTWWEPIFQGPKSIGLNKERLLNELEEETFLYFQQDDSALMETATME
ncbi:MULTISPECIES: hypothetical protein [unclassified Psychrobacillus]|uniref:hypothetical protein n=1 Tax=unclassified Psychrobacillus TaxID=2636677 RepID=UPI001642489C